MSGQLQELIDDLSQELGRPIEVEDRRWRLVAFSVQRGEIDAVRRDSILGRRAPADIADFLDAQRLDAGETPARVEEASLGMEPRTCLPLWAHGMLLGFLWVIEGIDRLGESEAERLVAAGNAIAEALWEERLRSDERRRRRSELVAQLLTGREPETTRRALAADLGWPADGSYVAAIGAGPDVDAGEVARRHWQYGELLAGQWEGHPLVIARLDGGASAAELAAVLEASGAEIAGVGGSVESLGAILRSVEQAVLAIRIAAATDDAGATVCFDDLDAGWRLVGELWRAAGEPSAPAAIRSLEAHDQATELLRTLEVTLESDGDVSSAAAELHMHRATLYRRLERIGEITGLDLALADDRLLAQIGLRLRRLSAARSALGESSRPQAP